MRAAILESPGRMIVQDAPEPCPGPDEVLIQIELAGVCGSDVALFEGNRPAAYPLILGHEAIGRIVDSAGTRVVIEPNIPCGTCGVCRRGRGNVCPDKRSLGLNSPGVFAERVAVPAEFVHPLPPEIGVLDAVGLEPLAVAVHAFGVGRVAAGDPVAVIGCGTEGLLLVQVAVAMGARVLAADVRAEPLAAAQRLGAEEVVQIPADDAQHEVAGGVAAHWSPVVVFEAAGSGRAVETALHMVANGGSVVVIGLAITAVPIVPLHFVRRGLSLLGSLIYDHPEDFQRSIELVRSGQVKPSAHASQIASLADAEAALQLNAAGRTGKVVLDVGGVIAARGVGAT
jgi:2-desacetyl-2-hydroxyethyl bacteriochlorophyllide A dehydrogenase